MVRHVRHVASYETAFVGTASAAEGPQADPGDDGHFGQTGDWASELVAFFEAGVDGVFADQPDLAVEARARASR